MCFHEKNYKISHHINKFLKSKQTTITKCIYYHNVTQLYQEISTNKLLSQLLKNLKNYAKIGIIKSQKKLQIVTSNVKEDAGG